MATNNLISTALHWLDQGVTTIPLKPMTKLPVFRWKTWINQLPTPEHINLWFKDKRRNIGVLCGNKFVVIDFDSREELSNFIERVPIAWRTVLDQTHVVSTCRGIHVYVDPVQPTGTRHLINHIDVRASGSFVLAPPSIHPSGKIYVDDGKPILKVDSIEEVIPIEEYEIALPEKKVKGAWESVRPDDGSLPNIEEIKYNLPIAEVVGWYTKVSRITRGNQWAIAHCPHPHHEDKHPSFSMNVVSNRCNCLTPWCALHRQHWYDVIDFYQMIEGIDFKTALEQLSKFT